MKNNATITSGQITHKSNPSQRPGSPVPQPWAFVETGSGKHPVYRVAQCRSTMDLAWTYMDSDVFPCWASVLADSQSSGRGQLGRTWHSYPGNLYGSIRLPVPGPQWRDLLSLVIARCLLDTLIDKGLSPSVKWPNDILIQGKKIAGILIEERSGALVVGIGVNLVAAPQDDVLHHALSPRAGYISQFGVTAAAFEIWKALIHHLRYHFKTVMPGDEPKQFLQRLLPHMAYMDERVLIDSYEEARQPVIIKNIDIRGRLIVQTAEGERIIRSGSLYPLI